MNRTYPSSFLDRLLPAARGSSTSPVRVGRLDFLEALARDVENLLNTLAPGRPAPDESDACADSILNYGLPDRAFFAGNPAETARLLASTIARFEPRLDQVRVEAVGPDSSRPGNFRLEVRARLVDQPRSTILLSSTLGVDRSVVAVTVYGVVRDER